MLLTYWHLVSGIWCLVLVWHLVSGSFSGIWQGFAVLVIPTHQVGVKKPLEINLGVNLDYWFTV
jgi:hypothetical protein